MYPISFIPEFLRNEVRRFHTTFDAATEDSIPEPARSADAIFVAKNKLAKYIKPTWFYLPWASWVSVFSPLGFSAAHVRMNQ
jgi:hypothetical protein